TSPRRGAAHVLVAVSDPANVWGRVFTITRADGTRVTPPRGAGWLVLRDGAPVLLAENHGRELGTLAAWQPADLSGAIDALAGVPPGAPHRRRVVERSAGGDHGSLRRAPARRARRLVRRALARLAVAVAVLLGVVAVLGDATWAEHEVYYRYTVLGYVKDAR